MNRHTKNGNTYPSIYTSQSHHFQAPFSLFLLFFGTFLETIAISLRHLSHIEKLFDLQNNRLKCLSLLRWPGHLYQQEARKV